MEPRHAFIITTSPAAAVRAGRASGSPRAPASDRPTVRSAPCLRRLRPRLVLPVEQRTRRTSLPGCRHTRYNRTSNPRATCAPAKRFRKRRTDRYRIRDDCRRAMTVETCTNCSMRNAATSVPDDGNHQRPRQVPTIRAKGQRAARSGIPSSAANELPHADGIQQRNADARNPRPEPCCRTPGRYARSEQKVPCNMGNEKEMDDHGVPAHTFLTVHDDQLQVPTVQVACRDDSMFWRVSPVMSASSRQSPRFRKQQSAVDRDFVVVIHLTILFSQR